MRYEYRVTVNGFSTITSQYPDWSSIFHRAIERDAVASLERRLIAVADQDWLKGLQDADGKLPPRSMLLGDRFVSAWEVMAQTKPEANRA